MKGPTHIPDASPGLSFSQMRHNKIMVRKRLLGKVLKGRSKSLEASAPFTLYTFYPFRPCVIIYVTFSSDRTASAALFLINVTHSSYLSCVTTIILPTSLRSLMPGRKIFSVRFPVFTPLSLCCAGGSFVLLWYSLNNFRILFVSSIPSICCFFADWCFRAIFKVIDTIARLLPKLFRFKFRFQVTLWVFSLKSHF